MVNCGVSDLKALWMAHWRSMSEDILHMRAKLTGKPDIQLSEQQLQYYTLAEIDATLRGIGRKLTDFAQMPQPPSRYLNMSRNSLIHEETAYDETEMGRLHDQLLQKCNTEQRRVYDDVLNAISENKGGLFFVYGSGGCGKTFLWNTIITKLRSQSKIVLPVASSGIAATLLPGGRTAHSRFKIPILLDDFSSCAIPAKSDIAELIKRTSLIIWDEAPMQHRYAFEALDRTLRDIKKSVSLHRYSLPFGGIPVLLGGDFRQILPVVEWGSRCDIVSACITRSRLWKDCKLFKLKMNMRLAHGLTEVENKRILEFGKWVLDVGSGNNPSLQSTENNDGKQVVKFQSDQCINSSSNSIQGIIHSTFPGLRSHFDDIQYLTERAILTPKNQTVSHINNLVLDNIPGVIYNYYSADKGEEVGNFESVIDHDFPVEYLNSLCIPGLPAHQFTVKVGAVVMLMRNLNQILGLCNGTRLIVRSCLKHTIECEVLTGNSSGRRHFIPRMELSPTDYPAPFLLVRRQFPLQLCYAMTINKAQGQSLRMVGLYLPKVVFTHGQLYVALSRVTSPAGLKVLIDSDEGGTTNQTTNVVYEEVFYGLI